MKEKGTIENTPIPENLESMPDAALLAEANKLSSEITADTAALAALKNELANLPPDEESEKTDLETGISKDKENLDKKKAELAALEKAVALGQKLLDKAGKDIGDLLNAKKHTNEEMGLIALYENSPIEATKKMLADAYAKKLGQLEKNKKKNSGKIEDLQKKYADESSALELFEESRKGIEAEIEQMKKTNEEHIKLLRQSTSEIQTDINRNGIRIKEIEKALKEAGAEKGLLSEKEALLKEDEKKYDIINNNAIAENFLNSKLEELIKKAEIKKEELLKKSKEKKLEPKPRESTVVISPASADAETPIEPGKKEETAAIEEPVVADAEETETPPVVESKEEDIMSMFGDYETAIGKIEKEEEALAAKLKANKNAIIAKEKDIAGAKKEIADIDKKVERFEKARKRLIDKYKPIHQSLAKASAREDDLKEIALLEKWIKENEDEDIDLFGEKKDGKFDLVAASKDEKGKGERRKIRARIEEKMKLLGISDKEVQ